MFFALLAVAGQIERGYLREKTLEGQVIAASKGNHGGRPKAIDDDMLTFAVAHKDKGVPVPRIAKKFTIKVGKNAGKHPSGPPRTTPGPASPEREDPQLDPHDRSHRQPLYRCSPRPGQSGARDRGGYQTGVRIGSQLTPKLARVLDAYLLGS